MPSDAKAQFKLNFSVWIPDLHRGKWSYKVVTTPLIRNGTFALVMLDSMHVLSTDVFPGSATGTANETRQVIFTVTGQVQVQNPQQLTLLSLTGFTYSSAEFSADGTVTVCTDCGGGGAGGITLTPTTVKASIKDPCDVSNPPAWCTPPPSAAECAAIPNQPGCKTTEPVTEPGPTTTATTTTSQTATTYVYSYTQSYTVITSQTSVGTGYCYTPGVCQSVTKTATSTVPTQAIVTATLTQRSFTGTPTHTEEISCTRHSCLVVDVDADGDPIGSAHTVTQTVDVQESGEWLAAGNPESVGARPRQEGGIMYQWLQRFEFLDTTYLVNWQAVLAAFIVAGASVLIFMAGYFLATHKRKRRH